jgi:hypothetical protein
MNENRIGRCLLPVSVTDRAVKNSGGYLPLPIVGEDGQPSGWPGEGPMCPPCPSGNPPVSFLRKRQSSTPLPTAGEAGGAQGTAG